MNCTAALVAASKNESEAMVAVTEHVPSVVAVMVAVDELLDSAQPLAVPLATE